MILGKQEVRQTYFIWGGCAAFVSGAGAAVAADGIGSTWMLAFSVSGHHTAYRTARVPHRLRTTRPASYHPVRVPPGPHTTWCAYHQARVPPGPRTTWEPCTTRALLMTVHFGSAWETLAMAKCPVAWG